ncbi:alpha/beta hydrolase [Pedobacter hiemivivus]|uniref:Alpha/beta hydrolase n=1 Tax=Pedobacter hiemivivus TaxID=2530454 RepID=A0A4U1GMC7_9SPHI|nr:alpha/beta hydrolase [Pedobacter hiemivivus]TKC65571.1 alpha/beta hydrolase [Pedobacter hiemivivus]
MKKLKQIITQLQSISTDALGKPDDLLWQYLFYSPKMPLRLGQEQLLQSAEKISLKVNDEYFGQEELTFHTFRWGKGTRKLLLTHGWGSKAADFSEFITALNKIDNLEIIAFDAPGNGSSEGDLSSLPLYVQAVKAVVQQYGKPDVLVGHSLGAMANVIALREMQISPTLLISLTPLIKLKENFDASMDAVNIGHTSKTAFFESLTKMFNVPASYFSLGNWHDAGLQLNHRLMYDSNDQISPYLYLKAFLDNHPSVKAHNYEDVGHEKILKSAVVIEDVVEAVKSALEIQL